MADHPQSSNSWTLPLNDLQDQDNEDYTDPSFQHINELLDPNNDAVEPNDHYTQAAAMTTFMPLPQETAIPARKRNNSLIPPELMNDVSEGGRERAALATVFGVREYSELKMFWQPQTVEGTSLANFRRDESSAGPEESRKSRRISILDPFLALASQAQETRETNESPKEPNTLGMAARARLTASVSSPSTTQPSYLLPDIPVVSRFNDFLIEDENGIELMFPANPSSVLLHSMTPIQRTQSLSSISTNFTLRSRVDPLVPTIALETTAEVPNESSEKIIVESDSDEKGADQDVAPPLLFIDYPPAIFDLLKADDDDRIIIWGPDPVALSAAMATTHQKSSVISSAASTTSSFSTLRASDDVPGRPPLKGFSTNTTSSNILKSRNSTSRPRAPSRWSSQFLSDASKFGKTMRRSNSLMMLPFRSHHNADYDSDESGSNNELRSTLLLRRAFGRKNSKKEKEIDDAVSQLQSLENIPQVIEAASVEKLVEKLTNTLDYTYMTDFFLTYRTFIHPTQLCKLLILRFRWALQDDDEDRRVVRIRTFVVIRHWLSNYFVHDFIPSRDLRIILTSFLNLLPNHPLVKKSPRDQRIVKGLKRVVRRLKKVYYGGSSSERVKIIAPPPPTVGQERVEEMVRAKLSQSAIRRKTALVSGVDVGGQHNGNMAVQDARFAPVVVIGSVNPKNNSHIGLDGTRNLTKQRSASSDAKVEMQSSPTKTIHEDSFSARSDAMMAMMTSQSQQINKKPSDDDALQSMSNVNLASMPNYGSRLSVVSGDSLESDLTPGRSDVGSVSEDDDYEFEDHSHGSGVTDALDINDAASYHDLKGAMLTAKLEQERRQREEEDERRRVEFFSVSEKQEQESPGPDTARLSPETSVLTSLASKQNLGQPLPLPLSSPGLQNPESPVSVDIRYPSSSSEIATPSASGEWKEESSQNVVATNYRDSPVQRTFPENWKDEPRRVVSAEYMDSSRGFASVDWIDQTRRGVVSAEYSYDAGRGFDSAEWKESDQIEESFDSKDESRQDVDIHWRSDGRRNVVSADYRYEPRRVLSTDWRDEARRDVVSADYGYEPRRGIDSTDLRDDLARDRSSPHGVMSAVLGALHQAGADSENLPNYREIYAPHTIRRIPSNRWCRKISVDVPEFPFPNSKPAPLPKKKSVEAEALPEEVLRELDIKEQSKGPGVPNGLSRSLSKKSIERRKSEKSLREASMAYEIPAVPLPPTPTPVIPAPISPRTVSPVIQAVEEPKVQSVEVGIPLPEPESPAGLGKKLLRRKKQNIPKVSDSELDAFQAVPYEKTSAMYPPPIEVAVLTTPSNEQSKRGLGKKLAKVFKTASEPKDLTSTVSPIILPRQVPSVPISVPASPQPISPTSALAPVTGPAPAPGPAPGPLQAQPAQTQDLAAQEIKHVDSIPLEDAMRSQESIHPHVTKTKAKRSHSTPQPVSAALRESVEHFNMVRPDLFRESSDKKAGLSSTGGGLVVSRIAEELRKGGDDAMLDSETCGCARCSGDATGALVECRRFSVLLLADSERRRSMELRRRRGASIDRDNRHHNLHALAAAVENEEKSRTFLDSLNDPNLRRNNGPIYLGHLASRTLLTEHDIGVQVNEADSDDDKISYAPTTQSIFTEAAASTCLAQFSLVSDSNTTTFQSRVTEQDLPQTSRQQSPTGQPSQTIEPGPSGPRERTHEEPGQDKRPGAQKRGFTSSIRVPRDEIPENALYRRSCILSHRSGKMAQQFCYIERDVLGNVDWEEMVHCQWTKMGANGIGRMDGHEEEEEECQEDSEKSVYSNGGNYTRRTRRIQVARQHCHGGVEHLIERFNRVCQWVACEIVRTRQLEERVKVIEKFIRLAQKCKMYTNFATLVQILLGLQSPSVSRLQKTWSRVGVAEMRQLDQLSAFTSPMRNWKHIRDSMTTVADEYGMSPTEVQIEMPGTNYEASKKTKIKMPFGGCIPFLGIYLSDLVFNSEQPAYLVSKHADHENDENHKIYRAQTAQHPQDISPVLKQSLVNFRKHRITATVVKRVLTFQSLARRYSFEIDDDIYYMCSQLEVLKPETIRRLSFEIE
ncbi:hypothetical protein CLU79DRAFT_739344 [Phycomyces nitens]|nr:hypothetical protein CLU79DRAFT_739344 [Phycomyces nitens]